MVLCPGAQGDGGILKIKVEFQNPFAFGQKLAVLIVAVRIRVQVPEHRFRRAADGQVAVYFTFFHELDGIVRGIGIIKIGTAVGTAHQTNIRILLFKCQRKNAVAHGSVHVQIEGRAVGFFDGVSDGIVVLVADDGVGGDGYAAAVAEAPWDGRFCL